jgi:hypothetical protein
MPSNTAYRPWRVHGSFAPDTVRVEVLDAEPSLGAPAAHSAGLGIVEGLTTAWGVTFHEDDGKTVWAEYRT